MTTAPGSSAKNPALHSGILFLVLGLSLAALGGAFMKTLTGDLSPLLIVWASKFHHQWKSRGQLQAHLPFV